MRNKHDRGGHFATVDAPDLFIQDIRNFWGNASLSGVDKLHAS